jgi:hypothetical protein
MSWEAFERYDVVRIKKCLTVTQSWQKVLVATHNGQDL